MVSRGPKKVALHEKLQLLRSITKSHALTKSSILEDASSYIQELKNKVETLNREAALAQGSTHDNHHQDNSSRDPVVTVETLEKGYLVNVCSERSSPGLLVSVLEAFEELGLNVTEARISCTHSFHLEAVGGDMNEECEETSSMDEQVVKQTILEAISNRTE